MSNTIQTCFSALLVLVVVAVLGITIGNLIVSVNIQKNQKNNVVPNNNGNGTVYNNTVYHEVEFNSTIIQAPVVYYQSSNPINVRANPQITSGNNNFQSYQNFVSILKQGLNPSVDPCNQFYEYTCSALPQGAEMSFESSDNQNTVNMIAGLENANYSATTKSAAVKAIIHYYQECKKAVVSWDAINANGQRVMNVINSIGEGINDHSGNALNETVFPFPMWTQQNNAITDFPTPRGLGYLLGMPIGAYGVSTLVSAYTDTKWKTPQKGYALILDQPSTFYPNTYYLKDAANTRKRIYNEIIQTMNSLAKTQNVTLDQQRLQNDANKVADFDFLLALNFSTDDTTRRQFLRSFNEFTYVELNNTFPSISWLTFFPMVTVSSLDAMVVLHNATTKNVVMEPAQLTNLLKALAVGNAYGITPEVLVNYVYYAAVRQYNEYLPSNSIEDHEYLPKLFTAPARRDKRRGVVPGRKRNLRRQLSEVNEVAAQCAGETMDMLQYANARVLIDQIFPTQGVRDDIRNHVAKVANSILVGMRSMLSQLDWMSTATKNGAYSKIDLLTKNMAYPEFITDDAKLDAYYANLGINDTDDYFACVDKATAFQLYTTWEVLNAASYNKADFAGPPGTTNAWYQDELNSITFPAGILHPPFYDYNWPAAVNFGAMGVIAGHELTHGFDDQGVQWDGYGALNNWMDTNSSVGFNNMAQCVINEYSGFCPLNTTIYGKSACVDGAQTQGENIADNGGIHAAWRAYKNYAAFNGPDPQLPDPDVAGFTADQLFFLGFAQVWCQLTPSDAAYQRQILVDVHSPSIYRVWGTIQNFPAFRSAFNCPVDTNYAPSQHCNVWVTDISSDYTKYTDYTK